MEILHFHPEVAYRSCDHCQEFIYWEKPNEEAGKVLERPKGTPVKRAKNQPTPCRTPTGCPKGTPENPRTLTPQNELALKHYKECKAVGEFPSDAIVRENAVIIADWQKARDRQDQVDFHQMLASIVTARG